MPGSTAAVGAAGATTLISKARRKSAAAMVAVGPSGSTVAALLTRMSTRPAVSLLAAAWPRCSSSARSAGTRDPPGRHALFAQQGAGLVQLCHGAREQDHAGARVA